MTLGAYLEAAAKTPWQPGFHDCCAWPARWARIPLPPYSSDDDGDALVRAAGGMVALWTKHIGSKLRRVSEPAAGDVGIIRAIGRDRRAAEIGAIYTGRRWAFLTPSGVAAASAEAVAIWRVPCRRH